MQKELLQSISPEVLQKHYQKSMNKQMVKSGLVQMEEEEEATVQQPKPQYENVIPGVDLNDKKQRHIIKKRISNHVQKILERSGADVNNLDMPQLLQQLTDEMGMGATPGKAKPKPQLQQQAPPQQPSQEAMLQQLLATLEQQQQQQQQQVPQQPSQEAIMQLLALEQQQQQQLMQQQQQQALPQQPSEEAMMQQLLATLAQQQQMQQLQQLEQQQQAPAQPQLDPQSQEAFLQQVLQTFAQAQQAQAPPPPPPPATSQLDPGVFQLLQQLLPQGRK